MPRPTDRAATDQRMAAVHALGHPSSPAPQTAWQPLEPAQGGGSTVAVGAAAPAALPPNAPGVPVLARGSGSDLIVTWTAPTVDPAHGAATGFAVRHGPSGAGIWTVVQGVSDPYELSDLPSAAAIDVQLRAANLGGFSMWSPTATLTTGGTSSGDSSPSAADCPPERPAATAWAVLSACGCGTPWLNQFLCRLARRLRTFVRRFARLLHLLHARRERRHQ